MDLKSLFEDHENASKLLAYSSKKGMSDSLVKKLKSIYKSYDSQIKDELKNFEKEDKLRRQREEEEALYNKVKRRREEEEALYNEAKRQREEECRKLAFNVLNTTLSNHIDDYIARVNEKNHTPIVDSHVLSDGVLDINFYPYVTQQHVIMNGMVIASKVPAPFYEAPVHDQNIINVLLKSHFKYIINRFRCFEREFYTIAKNAGVMAIRYNFSHNIKGPSVFYRSVKNALICYTFNHRYAVLESNADVISMLAEIKGSHIIDADNYNLTIVY